MNSSPHNEREDLSALFDGELDGNAARFALKRLGHDPAWQARCERWQLVGDVLRGENVAAAPRDFAGRVAAMVAADMDQAPVASVVVAAPVITRARSRRRWMGGAALAASVAVAALFVTRPSTETRPNAPDVATTLAVRPTPAAPVVPASESPGAPQQAPDVVPALATAVAVAEVPRRMAERRSSRGQSQRAALRSQTAATPAVLVAATAGTSLLATPPAATPFAVPAGEIVSRPWPRASVAGGTSSALAASYGTRAGEVSPFYPFEPQLPTDEPAQTADAVPQP